MNLGDIRDLDKDDLLELVGLRRKPSAGARMGAILGAFGLGLHVIGFLKWSRLAPVPQLTVAR